MNLASLPHSTACRNPWPAFRTLCLCAGLATVFARPVAAQSADPQFAMADGTVMQILVAGNTAYIAGDFTHVGPYSAWPGTLRRGFAAIDLPSGQLLPWDPQSDGHGLSMCAIGGTIYLHGSFKHMGGQLRNGLAAVDGVSAQLQSWDPNLTLLGGPPLLYSMVTDGSRIYVGGGFEDNGSSTHVAALDAVTGQKVWVQNLGTQRPYALALDGGTLFAGGGFTSPLNYLAAYDAASGQLLPWSPGAGSAVDALLAWSGKIYCGGDFPWLGGQTRARAGSLDALSGDLQVFNPVVDGVVTSLATDGTAIYLGGQFGHVGGAVRTNLAAVDPVTGQKFGWTPAIDNGYVACLAVTGSRVLAGGTFTLSSGQPAIYLASFPVYSPPAVDVSPHAAGAFRLEPATRNPSSSGLSVRLSLPDARRVHLDVFDVGGHRCAGQDLAPAAGWRTVQLAMPGQLQPGLYFVQARSGDRSARARICLIR